MFCPGIITAMVTPFTDRGELDPTGAESLARWLVKHGSDALLVAGTTGEAPTLSNEERERLFYAVRRGAGTAPIYMGTGSNDTRHAVQLSLQAEAWGADGLLVVTPYYNRPTQEGLFRHFTEIAGRLSIPVMLYNVPGRTGCNLEAHTVARIAKECRNVIAVKEAAGRLDSVEALCQECPELRIYTGDDALYYPALTVGACGVVSVASHVVGLEMAALASALARGDVIEARALHFLLEPIFRGLFIWPNPTAIKWLLNHLGIPVGPLRLPLLYPEDTHAMELIRMRVEEIWRQRADSSEAI